MLVSRVSDFLLGQFPTILIYYIACLFQLIGCSDIHLVLMVPLVPTYFLACGVFKEKKPCLVRIWSVETRPDLYTSAGIDENCNYYEPFCANFSLDMLRTRCWDFFFFVVTWIRNSEIPGYPRLCANSWWTIRLVYLFRQVYYLLNYLRAELYFYKLYIDIVEQRPHIDDLTENGYRYWETNDRAAS